MMNTETLKIAVAEPSAIIRSGVAVVLKRIQGFRILPIEIIDMAMLYDCVRLHKPDILIVNPAFLGYFDVKKFREEMKLPGIKCIALVCAVTDSSLLQSYDESITLYDDSGQLHDKLVRLLKMPKEAEQVSGQDILSGREKEIITCVVKGMTNKEIAERLFLSTHTVITHRRNIARKLQIHSPAGLTIYAIVNKLVELQDVEASLPQ